MISGGIPIGRYFGIQVKLHWSWFIIFVVITWALAAIYFPTVYPDWAVGGHVLVGVATSLLFFLSVLAHELAHSVVAKRNNIPIDAITLFLFGGVSQMTSEPKRPEIELRMSIAGPLTSLILGLGFLVIWYVTVYVVDIEPVAALAFWLGWINVILAGFNLIPGFPLDGGRVLRSLLWWRSRDLRKSTRIASAIGRGIGFAFIFGGVFLIFGGFWFQGLWIAFIGWFLENAASASYRQLALRETLQGHSADEIMTKECLAISPRLTVSQVVEDFILRTGRRCFPVVDDSRVLGLVTMHNVKEVPRDEWPNRTARDAMTPLDQLRSVKPSEDLSNVMDVMTSEDINQLPVVDKGEIIGMVSRDNLLSFINTRKELEK